jgi:hypothetical protein
MRWDPIATAARPLVWGDIGGPRDGLKPVLDLGLVWRIGLRIKAK